jgi:Flp pilus assembly protein TadG
MKNLPSIITGIQKKLNQGRSNERLERGQVLVIVTLSVIVLTAIVGLAVDTGLLYLNHGKLRRAVDAAALAATAQFREGYDLDDLQKAAQEFLVLNGINDPTAIIEVCDPLNPDMAICTDPPRKLVRVRATSVVKLTFLSVIGIHETTISASAVSEAASMDVVLVIDTSESMTFDADQSDPWYDPAQCNPGNDCKPFRQVKEAAAAFVEELYFPYDRVAIVTFDNGARTELNFSGNKAEVLSRINALKVVEPPVCPVSPGPCRDYERYPDDDPVYGNNNLNPFDEPIIDDDDDGIGNNYYGFACPVFNWPDYKTGNPDTCPTTAIGHGLKFAGNEFGNPATFRQEALWVTILLTDGAANAPFIACPNSTWTSPYCRDLSPTTRHCFQDDNTSCLNAGGVYDPENYDADDYARDMSDFVGKDQDSLIFTIGLGKLVRSSVPRIKLDANGNPTGVKCEEDDPGTTLINEGDPVDACWGAGEQLMRYAAEVGRGKYYYAPTGNQLEEVFLDIAQYLATRLTQ